MAGEKVPGTNMQVERYGPGKARVIVMGGGGSVQAIIDLPGDSDPLTDAEARTAGEIAIEQAERAAAYLRDRLMKTSPNGT